MRPLPIAAHTPARSRDDGVSFRDPEPPDSAPLKLAIARELARTDRLPVHVPALSLDLVDIGFDGRAIDLVFGARDPVAAIRISGPKTAIVVEIAGAARHRRQLEVVRERMATATTEERWHKAHALALELPSQRDVPLSFLRQIVSGVSPVTGLVRVGFQCNQDCGMCWQGRHWGRYEGDAILRWIEDLAAHGARSLLVSGGEPTLDKRLVEYVARASSLGITEISLETNAILATRNDLAAKLRDAGLTSAFVSLHSPDPVISDAITRAPGTHARTVLGIRAFLEAGVPVKLNAVLTREGIEHVAGLPDFVVEKIGLHPKLLGLMLSYPTAPFDPSLRKTVLPEPDRLRLALRATIARAFAVRLPLDGLDGPCGPPLCAFDADPRLASRAAREKVPFRRFLPGCDRCSVRPACLGVQDISAELYGDAAVHPI